MIHRIPRSVTPLDDWLAEVAEQVTLVTSEAEYADYRTAFPRVHAVPDYADDVAVEGLLSELCHSRPISTLVHVTEDDVLRSARVRERFGLPGSRPAEALPWRDKFLMKQRVSAAGVTTPAFTVPTDLADARHFAAEVGYPIVVKPRLGFASHGVSIVRDDAQLAACAVAWNPRDVLLEAFVPGEVYHVDGFTQDGKVLHVAVSRYLNDCLAFQDCQPLGSIQLDRDDEEWDTFSDFAGHAVRALPELDFCPYHLEIFRRPDGELVFCEIAGRLGGAHVMESFTHATGVNPARLWIRHQIGLENGPAVPLPDTGQRYGWLLIPPQHGRLVEIRPPVGVPYVKDFIIKTSVPRDFTGAQGSTDSVIGYVVEGRDSADVERNLRRCIALTEELTCWEGVQ